MKITPFAHSKNETAIIGLLSISTESLRIGEVTNISAKTTHVHARPLVTAESHILWVAVFCSSYNWRVGYYPALFGGETDSINTQSQ